MSDRNRRRGLGPLTPTGLGLLGAGLGLYGLSWWMGSTELAVVAIAAIALVVLASIYLLRSPALQVERRIEPKRVRVGQLAEGFVTVTNRGRTATAALVCEDRVGSASAEVSVPRLTSGRSVTVPYPLPTDRRSVVAVGPLETVFADPFGVVERRVPYGSSETLYVHPRVHALPSPRVGTRVDLDAEATSTTRGDATYHSLREYVVGDDLRRVHWKASAHAGTLQVREHVDPVRPDTTLVLDSRYDVCDPDSFEVAVEVVASLLGAAVSRGFPAQLTGTTPALRAGRTASSMGPILDLLAGLTQDESSSLDCVLGTVLRSSSGRALIVVTGAASSADLARLATAGRRFQEVVVVAVGGLGSAQALPGNVELIAVDDAEQFVAAWGRR